MLITANIYQTPGGGWKVEPDEAGPITVLSPRLSPAEWQNRYTVGAASVSGHLAVVVIDRGEPVARLDADHKLVTDDHKRPFFLHIGRKVVAQAYGEYTPAQVADLLRRLCLYYMVTCLCVVANEPGVAVIGALRDLPGRESIRLYLRRGRQDDMSVSWQQRYGYAITPDTREAFYAAIASWIEAEGLSGALPAEVVRSVLMIDRTESGRIEDISLDTLWAAALAAAVHASMQAQEAGRVASKSPHRGADYGKMDERDEKIKGEGAWWGYAVGMR